MGATCPGHRAEGWANHVRGVVAKWRRSRLDGVGRQALLGLLGPAVARSQTALSPSRAREALGTPGSPWTGSTGNPYCGGDETWGIFPVHFRLLVGWT